MIHLWEQSDVSDFCSNGGDNDQPFYIPVKRTDLISLRFQLPYGLVDMNGGGLPIGDKVSLSIVSGDTATTLCDYSNSTINKFNFGYINDSTNRIAEYQFLLGLGLADAIGDNREIYTFDVGEGDLVYLDFAGTIYVFKYGTDSIPAPLIEWKSGSVCLSMTALEVATASLTINGSPNLFDAIFSTPVCAHEDFACFRFKLTVELVTYGTTQEYYTKPFRVVQCDEPTIFVESTYPSGVIDCSGQIHSSGGDAMAANKLYMRIPAEIERVPSVFEKSYNSRSRSFKSSVTKKYLLKSLPIPQWYADAFETCMAAKTTKLDWVEYLQPDINSLFETNNELNGHTYPNIYLYLQSSKCETVFVCQ
jgi:hypothetical protein